MARKKPTILSIGKATQDVFLTSSKAFKPYRHKGVIYEQLPLGSKLHLDEIIFSTGGNATNAAVTFARQKLHSKYLWVLGNDFPSQAILQALDEDSVDTSEVVQHKDYRAGYSTILLAPNGERTVLNFRGTVLPSDGHPLDLEIIKTADWLYLSSLNNIALLERIVSRAAHYGVSVMLNPAESELKEKAKLKTILEDVAVLALNKEEAQTIVSGSKLEELVRRLARYCPAVLVSDGPNGVVATDSTSLVRAGMYEDVAVVDRTGAGDAFGAGFLSQFAQGADLEQSIIFASANSTSVVKSIGAKSGILHKGVKLHHMPISTKIF